MRLLFYLILPLLGACYPHWGKQVREDSAGWVRHADEACARGDRRAAKTFLLRAWEIDKTGEDRLDGELCPEQATDAITEETEFIDE